MLLLALFLFSCERGSDRGDDLLKFYGDALENIGYSISKTADGYIIAGQYMEIIRESTPSGTRISSSSKKIGVIKTDFDGNVIGEPVILGDNLAGSGTKIITLADGSALALGSVTSTTTQQDIHYVKIAADGSVDIAKTYSRKGNQTATDIVKTDEGFLVLGTTDLKRGGSEESGNAAGKKDIFLLRLNNNLDTLAPIPAVGFIGNDFGAAIKPDLAGGYIVIGTTDRSEVSGQSGNNLIIVRVNTDGSTTEPKIIGGLNNETASDFEVLSDGYLIVGSTGTAETDKKGHIWKIPVNIQSEPEIDERIVLSDDSPFAINAMCRYKSSSYLLAGRIGTGLSSRMLIFCVDAFGVPVEGRQKIAGGSGTQEAYDVICDENDNIITVGKNSYENNSMITFLKFRF